jgi:hypothetical protein
MMNNAGVDNLVTIDGSKQAKDIFNIIKNDLCHRIKKAIEKQ